MYLIISLTAHHVSHTISDMIKVLIVVDLYPSKAFIHNLCNTSNHDKSINNVLQIFMSLIQSNKSSPFFHDILILLPDLKYYMSYQVHQFLENACSEGKSNLNANIKWCIQI